MCMSKVWTTWQDNGAVAAEGSPRYTHALLRITRRARRARRCGHFGFP
jgi:hypothetical protein